MQPMIQWLIQTPNGVAFLVWARCEKDARSAGRSRLYGEYRRGREPRLPNGTKVEKVTT